MVGNILADSSYYISHIRRGLDPFATFVQFEDEADFFVCGVVKIEVLRGLTAPRAHARTSAIFDSMLYLPTPNALWERAAELAWQIDRKGGFVQVPDLLIAVCALEADATVLTLDSDFRRVPGLRVIDRLG